ncbi:glycosyltransferase [Listeria welshimeri]|uniref:glycosyltransferase n=1 Tax=Listeria welshimeri TaxID=1643 RepID=UPI00162776ED|nr:glycosyltransferase [Listeria welshimeri]MBC1692971.1 glycosyltransferase [Listeria welshimeri]MBF2356880.1 glycosyltransferase [Listeria welshimeri]MBF2379460.1 glycosyltransferase [Listeria welshimeri]MBF2676891.1 glycosyltransferase [Listeria welshimeri]
MHKLSVIVAVYNVSDYIEACLTSVLEQSYENIELIIVNDGSTDDSFQKIEKLVDGNTNVILIDQENQGVSAVRNNGVKVATGEYLGFVDGDDIIAKDMFQKMMASFEESDADIVTIGVARLSGDKVYPSTLHERFMVSRKEATTIEATPTLLYDTTSWNKVFKKSFWDKNHLEFPVGQMYEDIALMIPAFLYAEKVNIIPDVGYYWRSRDTGSKSITQRRNDLAMVNDRLLALRKVNQVMDEKNIKGDLRYQNERKNFEIDLFSMIEWAFLAPKDYYSAMQSLIKIYVEKEIKTNALNDIPKEKRRLFKNLLTNNRIAFNLNSYAYFGRKAVKKIVK